MSKLRRLFTLSPMFKSVKDKAKVEVVHYNKDGSKSKAKRVMYKCEICGELFPDKKVEVKVHDKKGKHKIKKKYAIAIDHIEPVVSEHTGFVDWNTWIERCFVGVEVWDKKLDLSKKLRLLCYACHEKVTAEQNAVRREVKEKKKNAKTSKLKI